jgi:putative Mg2+ transporter-C (MgtC) family protein
MELWDFILSISIKLVFALILGAFIGLERSLSGKEAGIRTFSLISLGSALFIILSNTIIPLSFSETYFDPTRTLGQIIVGLGFLAGGLVFFKENKVHGLTTAAAVWVSAAIGAAVGLGAYLTAIITTFLVVFVLEILFRIEKKFHLSEDEVVKRKLDSKEETKE